MRDKPCRKCGATERYPTSRRCAPCTRRSNNAWRIANPTKARAYGRKWYGKQTRIARHGRRLRRIYGLSVAEREAMERKQGGACAVCKRLGTEFQKGLVVDHCHATGVVRALLCTLCNTGIGCFRDRPAILRAAAKYLERHHARAT